MTHTRRDVLKLFGGTLVASLIAPDIKAAPVFPIPPGQPVRMPLDEFVKMPGKLDALRKGIKEMKKRKPSDPLGFFFQAAIHGIDDAALAKAKAEDPNVASIEKYWNQCPHHGEHSANFLPWHRAYTYHFEKILRLHIGDPEFALPYWNYMDKRNRKFPREFGIQHLDGDMNNNAEDNINPLYHARRDFYFAGYEHPYTKNLPLLQLSDISVDISLPMNTPVFFGKTEREGLAGGIADSNPGTRGLLESYPHDQIHRAVGGVIPNGCACACTPVPGEEPDFDAAGSMASPPTAGFDPIFSFHHTTIDWIWTQWSCMKGKSWGELPPASWFNEKPWFFFDVDGSVVNEPRRNYFDHRAMGIRFKYENMGIAPLTLPPMPLSTNEQYIFVKKQTLQLDERKINLRVLPNLPSVINLLQATKNNLKPMMSNMKADRVNDFRSARVYLELKDVDLSNTEATGFDVYLTTDPDKPLSRKQDGFLGSVSLFNHPHHKVGAPTGHDHLNAANVHTASQTFDISKALSVTDNAEALKLVVVPYALFETVEDGKEILSRYSLRIKGLGFTSMQ